MLCKKLGRKSRILMNKQYGAGVACSHLSLLGKEEEAAGAKHCAKGETVTR